MKLHYLFQLSTCYFILLPTFLFSQDQDSLLIVHAKWNQHTIEKGVNWYQGHFDNLFNSVQEINWVEIDLKTHGNAIHIAGDSVRLKPTSTFASENHAIIAINASFFDMKNGGSVDYLKINNQKINLPKDKTPNVRANAVFSISNNSIRIEQSNKMTVEESNAGTVMVAGPLLIEENEYVWLQKNAFNDNRHPRTAIAITKNNKLIFMVIDGRSNQANGMSLNELSKVFNWLGAKNAMNLDGGGSSALYIKGKGSNGIVNYPSDNKMFDHGGERSVANIIYFK